MSFRVDVLPNFEREAKHLLKKYKSLRSDLAALISSLEQNPAQGTPLGSGFYKVRMAVASKGKGKSGGARIITFVKVSRTIVYLVSIYDKSEKSTVTEPELKFLIRQIPE
ncbi:MAG TPA: type II toxin-antitoxin system RelE/ParE family toxin [Bacteroidia bacterium]|nr:type II toxin-antitoxin system RelE/ParE family toxin [Bacteroidia bacterium]